MRLELFYDSTVEPFQREAFDQHRIFELLNKLKKKGMEITITDTASWNSSMLYETYLKAVTPSVYKRYSIRKVFGTTRESGRYFGRQVPALLVHENDSVIDVYPHDEKRSIVTIIEFLEELIAKLPECEGHA
jgi:hypothetical protein